MNKDVTTQTLDEWLEYTKSLNLTLEELVNHIAFSKTCSHRNYKRLEGAYSKDKAKILFDLWENDRIKNDDKSHIKPLLKLLKNVQKR